MSDIGKRIRSRREELGMSQEELAHKLGYTSRSTINKIECGRSELRQKKIVQIANALDTSVDYIMGWEPELRKLAEKTVQQQIIDSYMSDPKIRELVLFAGGIEPGVERDKFIDAFITTYRTLRGGA